MRFKPGNRLRNVRLRWFDGMKIETCGRSGCSIFKQVCNNTGVTQKIVQVTLYNQSMLSEAATVFMTVMNSGFKWSGVSN
jgi:hypothetical protein